jgi:hypothetical protein
MIHRSTRLLGLALLFGSTLALPAEGMRPGAGSPATAILVQKLLQDHHFAGKPLTEENAKDWIKTYMESLDLSRKKA